MIPIQTQQDVESNGIVASAMYGISRKDESFIVSILRDTLYTDKVLAVVREYSSNAWDANRMGGNRDVPIRVTLPTLEDNNLTIEDDGPGLSQEEVFEIYCMYGASTKRDSNDTVGSMGIGAKSAFAYSDSFTITSRHGGLKKIYSATLDKSNMGVMNLIHSEFYDGPNGISIQIPVTPNDNAEFKRKCIDFFKYFSPRPIINVELPTLPKGYSGLKHGILHEDVSYYNNNWVAIMGCVPYKVDIAQLQNYQHSVTKESIAKTLYNLSGAVFFSIGDVQVSASREELKYSTTTKDALVTKLNSLVEEFLAYTIKSIEDNSASSWEKRLNLQIFKELGLPVPKAYENLGKDRAHIKYLKDLPGNHKCYIHRNNQTSFYIPIGADTKLIIEDDTRNKDGFNLPYGCYFVKKNLDGFNWEETEADLAELLKASELDGIPTVKLSSLPWTAPYVKPKVKKIANKKHHVKLFELIGTHKLRHPWSDAWKIIDQHVPSTDDIFILIDGFKPNDSSFKSYYEQDCKIADHFDIVMPIVYGYKSTELKPVDPKNCTGSIYTEWRKKFYKDLMSNPAVITKYEEYMWATHGYNVIGYYQNQEVEKWVLTELAENIKNDEIIKYLTKKKEAANEKMDAYGVSNIVNNLQSRWGTQYESEVEKLQDSVLKRYPLLVMDAGIVSLTKANKQLWYDYIKLVDNQPVSATVEESNE